MHSHTVKQTGTEQILKQLQHPDKRPAYFNVFKRCDLHESVVKKHFEGLNCPTFLGHMLHICEISNMVGAI